MRVTRRSVIVMLGFGLSLPLRNLRPGGGIIVTPGPDYLTIEWTAPLTGTPTGYRTEIAVSGQPPGSPVNHSAETFTRHFAGLLPNSLYKIWVTPFNDSGDGPTTTAEFYTQPGAAPTGIAGFENGPEAVELAFTPAVPPPANGGYLAQYALAGSGEWMDLEGEAAADAEGYSAEGLPSGTAIDFRFIPFNTNPDPNPRSYGAPSGVITVTTPVQELLFQTDFESGLIPTGMAVFSGSPEFNHTINTAPDIGGVYCMECSGSIDKAKVTIAPARGKVSISFLAKLTSASGTPHLIRFYQGATHKGGFRVNNSRNIRLVDEGGTNVSTPTGFQLTLNEWYQFWVDVQRLDGAIPVRHTLYAAAAGVTERPADWIISSTGGVFAAPTIDGFMFGPEFSSHINYYDNIKLCSQPFTDAELEVTV